MITMKECPLLLPAGSSCGQLTPSLSNGPHRHASWHTNVQKSCVPSVTSTVVPIRQTLPTLRTSVQCGWSGFLGESPSREEARRHESRARTQTTFLCGDSKAVLRNSMSVYFNVTSSWRTFWPNNHCRARFGDKFKRKLRKLRKERPNLAEKVRRGFEKVGLEREFSELPRWSKYVPFLAGAAEVAVMVFWAMVLKGDLRTRNTYIFLQGEGLVTLLLGANFTVGWLASQMSTWRVEALRSAAGSSTSGAGKSFSNVSRAAKPGVVDFARSFLVNLIPYGNFLAWTRFAWKESSPVSTVNALVYVVPSLVTLVLWTRGLGIFRVQLLAWMLGSVHRPYDAARVKNERVLAAAAAAAAAAARARALNAQKAEEERRTGGNSSSTEMTAEEMAQLQERRELEEFDILLSRSTTSATGGSTTIPGPPQDWSVGDTVQWLAREGFARYSSTFTDNDIDGSVLVLLTEDDLRDELRIQSLGDRRKLAQAIERLK